MKLTTVIILDELHDWATALVEGDQNAQGMRLMVQSSAIGRDLIGYVDRLRISVEETD